MSLNGVVHCSFLFPTNTLSGPPALSSLLPDD